MINVRIEYNTTKELVEEVLSESRLARNNKNALFIECCKKLGAKTLDDCYELDIDLTTIDRTRRIIQNKEKRFTPSVEVIIGRRNKERKIRTLLS